MIAPMLPEAACWPHHVHLPAPLAGARRFMLPLLYRVVRHPLYVGWWLAFWSTPTKT